MLASGWDADLSSRVWHGGLGWIATGSVVQDGMAVCSEEEQGYEPGRRCRPLRTHLSACLGKWTTSSLDLSRSGTLAGAEGALRCFDPLARLGVRDSPSQKSNLEPQCQGCPGHTACLVPVCRWNSRPLTTMWL